MTAPWLINAWYVAGEPQEVAAGKLCARTILGENVVLFRTESGKLTAMQNRCPHRFLPLSAGKVCGESIRCGYHGARYDTTGKCVEIPGQGEIPEIRTRTYPVLEKHGFIWIWMGDPAKSVDTSTIPDGIFMGDHPEWDCLSDRLLSIQANYHLIHDNLQDATHLEFVHPETLGSEYARVVRLAKRGEGEDNIPFTYKIHSDHHMTWYIRANNGMMGPFFDSALGVKYGRESWGEPADWHVDVNWWAPSSWTFHPKCKPAGASYEDGVDFINISVLTPETENSTHYFYKDAQRFAPDNHKMTEMWHEGINFAFRQDEVIVQEQQKQMSNNDLLSLEPALFSGDQLAIRTRKSMAKLIRQEQQTSAGIKHAAAG